jgi:hypothetical protein
MKKKYEFKLLIIFTIFFIFLIFLLNVGRLFKVGINETNLTINQTNLTPLKPFQENVSISIPEGVVQIGKGGKITPV